MYLKSLELHGFKSFPNRTVLSFERGATVIVGPNGSGKSNISDAMRWVLGELSSRNIRGTKMEDVIFGGTDDRRPMGFAEVSVTFDNSDPVNRLDNDADEVVVTRRYFRTGDSEYLINRQPRRLRDIYELFMNTGVGREGYSIIGQGKIAEIISKKSDERRNIFEEAAGISKYRHRKEETERKLKHTQENLDRVKDILTLLEERVGPLEKEAEKARRGLAIYEEKKRADVSLWLFDTKKIRVDIEEAEQALKLATNELEIIDQMISDLELQDENLYQKNQEGKILSEQLFNDIRETTDKLHDLDNAIRVAENNFEHSAELINQCNIRIKEIDDSKASLNLTKAGYLERKGEHDAILKSKMDDKLEIIVEQQNVLADFDAASKDVQEALDELTVEENTSVNLKIRIDVLKNSKESSGTKSVDVENEIKKYEAEGLVLKAEADKCEKNASGFRNSIAEKDAVISETSARIEELTETRDRSIIAVNNLKLKHDTASQRADVLQKMNDHFEGYGDSIKFVMKEYSSGNISGSGKIYGPISSLINVDKKYITAIETALGSSLQNIVVENEETAKAAMYALKRANAGRATFYPISAIRPSSESEEIRAAKGMEGYVGRADTLVESDSRYRSIIEYLLLRVVVFDNIENASVAAKKLKYRVRMVTLDGQIINAGGSFTGGSAKRDSGILTRLTSINELKEQAESLSIEIQKYEKQLSEIDSELATAKERNKNAEQEKELLLSLSRSQFAALDTANAKYNANREIIDKLTFDYNNLIGQKERADEEIIVLEGEFKANAERIAALKAYREKRSLEMGVLDDKNDELTTKINEMQISIAEVKKDIEAIESLIETVDNRILELDNERNIQRERIENLENKRKNIDSEKLQSSIEYKNLLKQIDDLRQKRTEVESENDEIERVRKDISNKVREKNSSRQVAHESKLKNESKHSQLLEKQDKLGSQLWDDYEITYEQAVALSYPPVTEENRDEVAHIQSSCRARLRALGSYNPGAIEEYAQIKTQYDDLNTQFTDLTSSYDELTGIISRLETEMRTSFVNAFNAINKNFGITFKELFGGGSAELLLTDPEDVLTSGIEIKAAPPGKIIKNLALLSGGEQSFVAIALLFAILKVNPTPFCILDEIEAALDEVNVYRFGEYIKKFDDGTQFILITHRRGTMEIGDRLYGVTMPQRGISQAIELNVNEIEGRQEEILDGLL